MKDKILLFIPMYNCEKQIVRVLGQIDQRVLEFVDEIIVVNNQSTDNGAQAVLDYKREHPELPLHLMLNRNNYGLGGSHKVAFNYAIEKGFDYVIVLHGDDQGDIHDLLPYLRRGIYRHYDSFLGSRFSRRSKLVNYSKFRIFGNHVFNMFTSLVLRRRIKDLGSGLNMYSVDYLKSGFYKYFINSLTFNVYMLIYGVYSKSDFAFFPLTWREEDQVSNAKFFKQSLEILKVLVSYRLNPGKTFAAKENEYSAMEYISDEIR